MREGAQVIAINPAHVEVSARIGFMHEDKAVGLGRMMATDGQRDPIKVTRLHSKKTVEQCLTEGKLPWRLVVGWTRLRGCQIEGIDVLAIEVRGTPQQLAEMEASENIDRREIGPLEKAKFVVALADAARARLAAEHGEDLSNQQLAIKARWMRAEDPVAGLQGLQSALEEETDDTCSQSERVYGWQQSVRDAFGLGRTRIWQLIKLYRMLVEPFPDLAEPLAKHPVVGENLTQLLKIASQRDKAVRRRVIEALIAEDELTADAAIQQHGETTRSTPKRELYPHEKQWSAVSNNWRRMGVGYKRQYLPTLLSMLTPDLKLEARDLLNEELGDA
ncbi:MAG: hypothetical protein U0975_09775 [Erythrobacter sp.]|nr:hypothetical protein [Erythrobacter sp.]